MLEENTLNSALAMLSTATPTTYFVSLLGSLVAYGFFKTLRFIYRELTNPLRDFPGPPRPSFIFGNVKELYSADVIPLQEKWIREYGNTMKLSTMLGTSALLTTDLKALSYVITHSYDFQKLDSIKYRVRQAMGDRNSVILVEGEAHKNQRRLLNPAFGPQQIRELTGLFVKKAAQLRDLWSAEVTKNKGVSQIDGMSWLVRTSLDIIGIAGFNYEFNALVDQSNNPFMTMFSLVAKHSILTVLKDVFPTFRIIPTKKSPQHLAASTQVNAIIHKLVNESKAAVASNGHDSTSKTWDRRDLLSLLIRANTMPDLPQNKRLNDEDIEGQILTFLVAGHETTAFSTMWALYALTQNKEAQKKLREEINTITTDEPTLDDLNSLKYLDRVIRESLRLHSFPPFSIRVATKDNVIPLSTPFTDKKGVVHNEIRINKGQNVLIPVGPVNRSKALWGEDSLEYKPERWEKVPEAATAVPGVWGNVLTFLGGPRACIGYRFALAEMKALLFTIIRSFELDLAVPGKDIAKSAGNIPRPIISTERDQKSATRLPLIVRPVSSQL